MEFQKPKRYFKKSGYVNPEKSYHVQLENVRNELGQDMKEMIDEGRYFTIFAPGQSGKTTFFYYFCKQLEKESTYITIQLSFQKLTNYLAEEFYQFVQNKLYFQLLNRLESVNSKNPSPFNIADHVKLPSFTLDNIKDLYAQYTKETNQPFSDKAIQKIFEETAGQTWLVNRLGNILTRHIKLNTTEAITVEDVGKAVEQLIQADSDHFYNLEEKLDIYKSLFFKIAFNDVRHNAIDKGQAWLRQYEIQNLLDEIDLLKDDVDRELKIKKVPDQEIELVKSDIEVAEKALIAIETSHKQGQKSANKPKNQLKRFIRNISKEKSSIYRALKQLRDGEEYGIHMIESYNKIKVHI